MITALASALPENLTSPCREYRQLFELCALFADLTDELFKAATAAGRTDDTATRSP
jgi:hypothetical protein